MKSSCRVLPSPGTQLYCYNTTNVVCVWKRLDNKVAAEPAMTRIVPYVFSSTHAVQYPLAKVGIPELDGT
jgi:hypothetical protein